MIFVAKIKFTTTLDSELVKKAKIEAIERGISVAELVERLLKDYFSNNSKNKC